MAVELQVVGITRKDGWERLGLTPRIGTEVAVTLSNGEIIEGLWRGFVGNSRNANDSVYTVAIASHGGERLFDYLDIHTMSLGGGASKLEYAKANAYAAIGGNF